MERADTLLWHGTRQFRQVAASYSDSYGLVSMYYGSVGLGEAGCCRQVAALHSDRYREVLLYMMLLDQGKLAALDRWLHCLATTVE